MHYTTFGGRSGLRVSEFALGTSNFGTKWGTGADWESSKAIFETFAEAGGTFIDTADTYQQGESETFLADYVSRDRDHFTLASKFTFGTAEQSGINKTGNGRKNIRLAVEASLRRLNTDHLDLYWVHSPDFVTPIDEVVDSLQDLISSGKILYGGLSNFPAWQVALATSGGSSHGSIIGTQFEYSLAARDGERDLIPMAENLGLGVAIYSPLGGGLLTGKYRGSKEGRLTTMNAIIQREDTPKKAATVDALLELAEITNIAPAALSIAWLLERNKRSSTSIVPIIGPRTVEQLQSYLDALTVELTAEQYAALASASAPELGIPHDSGVETLNSVLGGQLDRFVLPNGSLPGPR